MPVGPRQGIARCLTFLKLLSPQFVGRISESVIRHSSLEDRRVTLSLTRPTALFLNRANIETCTPRVGERVRGSESNVQAKVSLCQ
jgi:hypothetical protein